MKKHKRLSIEELRSFPGFENFTEEELEREIKILETLSILFYELFMKREFHVANKNPHGHMKEKLNNVKPLKQEEDHETEQQRPAA